MAEVALPVSQVRCIRCGIVNTDRDSPWASAKVTIMAQATHGRITIRKGRDGDGELCGILRARPAVLHGRPLIDSEVVSAMTRLKWVVETCPLIVLLVATRVDVNTWTTEERRFVTRLSRCMLGCADIDTDGLRHYGGCPRLSGYLAARHDLRRPLWLLGGIGCLLFALPTSREDALRLRSRRSAQRPSTGHCGRVCSPRCALKELSCSGNAVCC